MRSVSIIGIGITDFGALPEGIVSLGAEACCAALADGGISPERVDAFFLGNFAGQAFTGQSHLAPMIAHAAGLGPVPCTRLEGACASGGLAMRQGVQAVASGAADMVLVAGAEKMSSTSTTKTAEVLAAAGDWVTEGARGATFPALFALMAKRHMHEFSTTREDLAGVSVKNHSHGMLNPKAHFRKEITVQEVLEARPVADPLGMLDCSPISDGAAAVVLCPDEMVADLHATPVSVLASAQASGPPALSASRDITRLRATVRAAEEAFRVASLQPEDIDLAEVHDCFSIAEIIALEDIGFYPKGEGGRAAREGETALGGAMPVNTSGGLKAKGHPVGATGVAQICEIALQLRGEAGARQVPGAEFGLAHNLGGSGATCAVHILRACA
ncbi:MAG: thiolase domain-containing protein [Nitrospinaceae bacterium]|jgi:acetyl-CoA C-acetyltransferase|nr:thiolase domain-containing protein [Nitrospinaceae bacterium]MBT4095323.1 thiolase domain-containing protein [Nitrospinaceae bacterium]MBT4432578.1 thiolase domain-containing protein [Nitrospinaceae bacterium]MBT5368919.1 thiolase domain-containing protein [Nitrospinaceae bacterium]MBT5948389.1 thiolase domain-containing protein [Nitrospinaceae bacterium]